MRVYVPSSVKLAVLLTGLNLLPGGGACRINTGDIKDALSEAITALETQSEAWQDVVTQTRDQLLTEGRQDLVADLDRITQRAVATTGVELRCNVDFVGDRLQAFIGAQVREALINLRARDRGEPEVEYYSDPKACHVSPEGTLQGDRIRDGDDVDLVWYGYDFFQDGPDDAKWSVALRNQSTGIEADITSRLALSTHYQMGLNLHNLHLSLAPETLYKIVVRWDGATWSEVNLSPPTVEEVPLPACTWTASFSEEGSHFESCASGFLMQGVRCRGEYCDNKELYCCPYSAAVDNARAVTWSVPFSEEGSAQQINTSGFVGGVGCSGRYCDNVYFMWVATPLVGNNGQCTFQPFVSEEHGGERLCPDGTFVAGAKCQGSYCDNISLYCCGTR